ncbi:hypothetical protein JCM10207_004289 [Rhodosporidiobolus poonsookiae]
MPVATSGLPNLAGLAPLNVDGQRQLPTGFSMPFVATSDDASRTAEHWVKMVKENWAKEEVDRVLAQHGAILLRDLPIRGPPSLYIAAHTEFGISTIFPSRICFWAMKAPEEGGETPINSGALLAQRLKEEAPDFVEELAKKGVRYTIYHPPSKLSNDANGNGVLAAWGSKILPEDDETTVKAKVEAEIQRISPTTTWEWQPDGGLFTFQRTPAFRNHPILNVPVIFGNISSYYGGAINRGTLEPPYLDATGFYKPPPLYGDDSPIPLKYLDLVMRLIEEDRTLIKWKENDVFIIDNLASQHSRLPWTKGERRILASLWDSGLEKLASPVYAL